MMQGFMKGVDCEISWTKLILHFENCNSPKKIIDFG